MLDVSNRALAQVGYQFYRPSGYLGAEDAIGRSAMIHPEWAELAAQGAINRLYGIPEADVGCWFCQCESSAGTLDRPHNARVNQTLHDLGHMVLAGSYDRGKVLALNEAIGAGRKAAKCMNGYQRRVRKVQYSVCWHCGITMP